MSRLIVSFSGWVECDQQNNLYKYGHQQRTSRADYRRGLDGVRGRGFRLSMS